MTPIERARYEEMMRKEAEKENARIAQARLNIARLKILRNEKAAANAALVGFRGGRQRHRSRRVRKGSRSRRTRKA